MVKNPLASEDDSCVAPPHSAASGTATQRKTYCSQIPSTRTSSPNPYSRPRLGRSRLIRPALHQQAGDLLQSATADAETILSEAHTNLRTIVESAQTGAAEISQQARTEGHDSGYHDGVTKAESEMEEMLATMRGLIDMARVERHKIVEGAESEIVKLAMGIAEKVINKAVEVDRDVVVAITKAAIGELVAREAITVRVNPIDLERMKQHRDSMLALGETKHMRSSKISASIRAASSSKLMPARSMRKLERRSKKPSAF